MREILFRGKRVDNDEWIEGCFLQEERPIQNAFFILNSKGNFRVHNTTVGQLLPAYKLYEGDIIIINSEDSYDNGNAYWEDGLKNVKATIEFKHDVWLAKTDCKEIIPLFDFDYYGMEFKIIGNIYDK